MEEQTLTSLHVAMSTCGSTGNFSVLTSLLQELGDQMELERISKLEYLMRTKEHGPTWTRVEATQRQGGGWLDFFFYYNFPLNYVKINYCYSRRLFCSTIK